MDVQNVTVTELCTCLGEGIIGLSSQQSFQVYEMVSGKRSLETAGVDLRGLHEWTGRVRQSEWGIERDVTAS